MLYKKCVTIVILQFLENEHDFLIDKKVIFLSLCFEILSLMLNIYFCDDRH